MSGLRTFERISQGGLIYWVELVSSSMLDRDGIFLRNDERILVWIQQVELQCMPDSAGLVNGRYVGHLLLSAPVFNQVRAQVTNSANVEGAATDKPSKQTYEVGQQLQELMMASLSCLTPWLLRVSRHLH